MEDVQVPFHPESRFSPISRHEIPLSSDDGKEKEIGFGGGRTSKPPQTLRGGIIACQWHSPLRIILRIGYVLLLRIRIILKSTDGRGETIR